MKLTAIKLCNFRSFYGKTPELILAGGEEKNTTIIYGNNGTGKTSLLNAFTWVLYEKFSAAFASAEQLVNISGVFIYTTFPLDSIANTVMFPSNFHPTFYNLSNLSFCYSPFID